MHWFFALPCIWCLSCAWQLSWFTSGSQKFIQFVGPCAWDWMLVHRVWANSWTENQKFRVQFIRKRGKVRCVPDLLIGFFLHVDKDRSDISHFCICTCIFKKSRNETKCGAKINYIITINSSTWIQIHSIQTRVISQLLEFPGIHVTQICQERSNVWSVRISGKTSWNWLK